jgi:hypothetical protein
MPNRNHTVPSPLCHPRRVQSTSFHEGLWYNQTSAGVELCLTRAAKQADALTNSENAARDAEKAAKNGCGTGSGLGRQPLRLETERRPETQVRRNIGAIRGGQPSTNGQGIQFGALEWLPTLDAFRTFATEYPTGMLPGFLSAVSSQIGAGL